MKKNREHDADYLFKVEKQIAKKFGEEAIVNPRSTWDDEKEKQYLEEIKEEFRNRRDNKSKVEERNGFSVRQKLINRENRVCCKCDSYSFSRRDDLYLNKFEVCEKCYFLFVEGRESKWQEHMKSFKH